MRVRSYFNMKFVISILIPTQKSTYIVKKLWLSFVPSTVNFITNPYFITISLLTKTVIKTRSNQSSLLVTLYSQVRYWLEISVFFGSLVENRMMFDWTVVSVSLLVVIWKEAKFLSNKVKILYLLTFKGLVFWDLFFSQLE